MKKQKHMKKQPQTQSMGPRQAPIFEPDDKGLVPEVISDGNYLRAILKDYRITAEFLADDLGYSLSYLNQILADKNTINVIFKKDLIEMLRNRKEAIEEYVLPPLDFDAIDNKNLNELKAHEEEES
jgi:transcriptional regulator with XRE-family HTH domain